MKLLIMKFTPQIATGTHISQTHAKLLTSGMFHIRINTE